MFSEFKKIYKNMFFFQQQEKVIVISSLLIHEYSEFQSQASIVNIKYMAIGFLISN
jgi:hypothetical protein